MWCYNLVVIRSFRILKSNHLQYSQKFCNKNINNKTVDGINSYLHIKLYNKKIQFTRILNILILIKVIIICKLIILNNLAKIKE